MAEVAVPRDLFQKILGLIDSYETAQNHSCFLIFTVLLMII